MKILVTFAVEAEFAPWKARHDFQLLDLGIATDGTRVRVYEAHVGAKEPFSGDKVWVFLTGMGWGRAKCSLRKIMNEWPVYCISSGLAGGLSIDCKSGEVVVSRQAKLWGTTHSIEGHRPLIRAAVDCGARIVRSSITTDSILSSADQKREASASGDIVDMESYHILTAASGHKVPFCVVVRAISDGVDEDIPIDFAKIANESGQLQYGQLLSEVGRNPHKIPALIGFGIRSHRAAKALADFLDRYVPAIQHGTKAWSNEHFDEAVVG